MVLPSTVRAKQPQSNMALPLPSKKKELSIKRLRATAAFRQFVRAPAVFSEN